MDLEMPGASVLRANYANVDGLFKRGCTRYDVFLAKTKKLMRRSVASRFKCELRIIAGGRVGVA